jgi:hypothetical protein
MFILGLILCPLTELFIEVRQLLHTICFMGHHCFTVISISHHPFPVSPNGLSYVAYFSILKLYAIGSSKMSLRIYTLSCTR